MFLHFLHEFRGMCYNNNLSPLLRYTLYQSIYLARIIISLPDNTLFLYGSFLTVEGSFINEPHPIHIGTHPLRGNATFITLTLHIAPSHSF